MAEKLVIASDLLSEFALPQYYTSPSTNQDATLSLGSFPVNHNYFLKPAVWILSLPKSCCPFFRTS